MNILQVKAKMKKRKAITIWKIT